MERSYGLQIFVQKYEPVLKFLIQAIAITGWINFDARKLLQIFVHKYEPVLRFLINTIAEILTSNSVGAQLFFLGCNQDNIGGSKFITIF